MSENVPKGLILLIAGVLVAVFVLFSRPGYLSDYTILAAVLGAEVMLVSVVKYRQVFFPILMAAFLCAGVNFPFQTVFLYARWLVLGIGATVGLAVYIRSSNHFFSAFHLITFFCALSAIVSALVSAYPEEALLKALSLVLLFLYAATGGRAAMSAVQPEMFFRKMLTACEILTAFTAISYFALRWEFFGNPNSLGAVMGVAVIPMLLWGLVAAEQMTRRRRLGAVLLLAILLLMSSFARAAICAAAVSGLLICLALRQYRLLVKGATAAIVIATAVAMFAPRSGDLPQWNGSEAVSDVFLYKGHAEAGVLGSRRGVWGQTWNVIQNNPWFGSGFGTSIIVADGKADRAGQHINSWVTREHGNSYLEIAEWVGLLGALPFVSLVILSLNNVRKVFASIRRTGDGLSPALPAAAIVVAGLVHAGFEDWLFAVGYYLCVLFWTIAFLLVDVLPRAPVVYAPSVAGIPEQQFEPVVA